jgi:serine phosphatase RsbU (regulator of sigma subunit)
VSHFVPVSPELLKPGQPAGPLRIQVPLAPAGGVLPIVEIGVSCRPKEEQGGDFARLYSDGRRLLVFLADPMGHRERDAASACHVCAQADRVIRVFGAEAFLARLGDRLEAHPPKGQTDPDDGWNVQALAILVEPERERLQVWKAGHAPAYLIRSGGPLCRAAPTGGIPLGIFEGAAYLPTCLPFLSEDRLLCFTDGAESIRSPSLVELGEDGLLDLALRHSEGSAYEMLLGILGDIRPFGEPRDDLTLLTVEMDWKPGRQAAGADDRRPADWSVDTGGGP